MPEERSQADWIVRIVEHVFVSHRVTERVGVEPHADDRGILVAEFSHSVLFQRPATSDEDPLTRNGRANIEPGLQRSAT